MAIERVEIVPYALPFREPYVTARGALHSREMVMLRLFDESGEIGLGEAVPLSMRGDKPIEEVERSLAKATARLVGLNLRDAPDGPLPQVASVVVELATSNRLGKPARAAVEGALLDLAAKLAGEPMWRTLGATEAKAVACNATLTAGTPAEVAKQARRYADLGFETFKLKLGTGEDVGQVSAVRDALGPSARLRIDANEAWDAKSAELILGELEAMDIELAEQPVAGLRAMSRVARSTSIPLAGDELIGSPADAGKAARRGACEMATLKLSKLGGIGPAMTTAARMPGYLSSSLDGPVGIATAAHAAQLLRTSGDAGVAHGLATSLLFSATVASKELLPDGGRLLPGDEPGLGIEIDDDRLASLRLPSAG
jgi:L-alanine-DL-glutamate epimerase-like enolase superfamily enzyme